MTDSFKGTKELVFIAIMSVGAYQPWQMHHCNPEEALQMVRSKCENDKSKISQLRAKHPVERQELYIYEVIR